MKNITYTTVFFRLGQIAGVTSGSITAILWMFTLWMPDAPFSFGVASMAVILIMIVLAIVAIVASLKGHFAVLLVIFGVSFFPIGLYVLGVPHWIQWVGLSNMGYLLAAILIWRFRPPRKEQSAQSG